MAAERTSVSMMQGTQYTRAVSGESGNDLGKSSLLPPHRARMPRQEEVTKAIWNHVRFGVLANSLLLIHNYVANGKDGDTILKGAWYTKTFLSHQYTVAHRALPSPLVRWYLFGAVQCHFQSCSDANSLCWLPSPFWTAYGTMARE